MASEAHEMPPMSCAKLQSRVVKTKADHTQHCIDTINKTCQLWPKDAQKYARDAKARCGEVIEGWVGLGRGTHGIKRIIVR